MTVVTRAPYLGGGLVASATIFPREETFDVGPLMDALRGMLDEHDLDLVLDESNDCVNVLLPGIDKASGFAWLCEELGVWRAPVLSATKGEATMER